MSNKSLDELAAHLAQIIEDVDGQTLRAWAHCGEPAVLAAVMRDLAGAGVVGARLAQAVADLSDDARRLDILARVRGERSTLEAKRDALLQRRRQSLN